MSNDKEGRYTITRRSGWESIEDSGAGEIEIDV